jgi:hypothetical protein
MKCFFNARLSGAMYLLLSFSNVSLTVSEVQARQWTVQTVVSDGLRGQTSLAVDASNRPHIVYQDLSNPLSDFDLKYAYWSGGQWRFETIDTGSGNWGTYTSLALDSSGIGHVAYGHGGNVSNPFSGPRYAVRSSSGWVAETVPTNQATGQYTALALDSLDRPHITYSGNQYDPEIATKSGTTWTRVKVRNVSDVVGSTSVAIDENNFQHIAYAHRGNESINYVAWNGTSWVNRQIEAGGINSALEVSIALNSESTPYIAYSKFGPTLAVWEDNAWHIDNVESVASWSISLAVDQFSRPHLVYFDRDNSLVKYATRHGDDWTIEVIDSGWYNGQGASLEIDSKHRVHISWYDSANYALKYAVGVSVPEPNFLALASMLGVASLSHWRRRGGGDV